MRFSCQACQATFQTATTATAPKELFCPACGAPMVASADVVELHSDRAPTRRYDLDDLRARIDAERDLSLQKRGQEQRAGRAGAQWFAGVQGRQVGPLSVAGLAGLRARGQLTAASLVWREGWPGWVAIEAVDELRAVVGLPAAPSEEPRDREELAAPADERAELPGGAEATASLPPPPPPPPDRPGAEASAPLEDGFLSPAHPPAQPPPLTERSSEPGAPVVATALPSLPESTPFETSFVPAAAVPGVDVEAAALAAALESRPVRPEPEEASRPLPPAAGEAQAPFAAEAEAEADSSPAPVLELSTPPRARRSRGPMQQTWFADEEPRRELPGRKVVIGIAIGLALIALVLLLRGGGGS